MSKNASLAPIPRVGDIAVGRGDNIVTCAQGETGDEKFTNWRAKVPRNESTRRGRIQQ
jgi:hypothetical protein